MSGDKMCRIQKADDLVDSILTVQKAVNKYFIEIPNLFLILSPICGNFNFETIFRSWCAMDCIEETLPVIFKRSNFVIRITIANCVRSVY